MRPRPRVNDHHRRNHVLPPEGGLLDPDTEHAVRAFLAKAARQYEETGAILFGSRARHGHRPDSDADVAVLLRACSWQRPSAR